MKKFIKICKAILPRVFSSSTLALVISLVTNCVFSYVCKFEVTCNQAFHMRLSTAEVAFGKCNFGS